MTVKVHKSSSRDGGLGWELVVNDSASEAEVSETISKAVAGHRRLAEELGH